MEALRLTLVAGSATAMTVLPVCTLAAGWLSMKYSAATTLWLPVATSEPVACRATLPVPLVKLGVRLMLPVEGPALSRLRTVEETAPQPLAS